MIEMYATPEKVGKDMRFFDVVETPGNSRAAAIPADESWRSSAYRYGEGVDAKLRPRVSRCI
jgi:hypothetical protein